MDNETLKKILVGEIAAQMIGFLRDAAAAGPEVAEEALAERLGMKPEIRELGTPQEMQAYLDERARRSGLIAKCICPECDKTVDRRKRSSGACCKAHMNYECNHPDCVAKAKRAGWKRYTHPYGTKIASEHLAWRRDDDAKI